MKTSIRVAALGIALALVVAPLTASAWVTYGPDWASDRTTMSLNLSSTWNPTAEDALFRWNAVPGHTFSFFFDNADHNRCSRGFSCIGTDGNAVEWEDFSDGVCSDPASGALAVTRLNWLVDFCNADVLFNTTHSWTTSTRECATGPPYNFSSVAIHEFGHALGLSHENDELATLNSIYHPADKRIHGDDQEGIRAIYDASGGVTNIKASHWKKTSSSASQPAVITTISPTTVSAGNSLTYEWTQENAGSSTATFDIGFYLSTNNIISRADTLLGENFGASATRGFAFTTSRTLTIPSTTPSGTYYVGHILDHNDLLAETSENDNAVIPCTPITVIGKPDLDITSINAFPKPLVPGQAVSVSQTVTNSGGAASGTFRVGLYLSTNSTCSTSDVFMGARTVSSLGVGASSAATTAVTVPATTSFPSTRWVCAIADDQGAVSEISESNNTDFDQAQVVECTSSTHCSDGSFCNGPEDCSGNVCQSSSGDPCPGPDGDGNCSESCNEALDNCTAADLDGTTCTDGMFCNGTDTCDAGACSIHTGDPCPGPDADGNCSESCDEELVSCTAPDPAGSACPDTDENECTAAGCDGTGTCDQMLAIHCDDGDACTADDCDPLTGCTHTPIARCQCGDGIIQDTEDCETGPCCRDCIFAPAETPCPDDGDVCTDDVCTGDSAACAHLQNTVPCNDGNACTRTDACRAGTCVGGDPVICSAPDVCHEPGICDPLSGGCLSPAKPDGTECNNGSACQAESGDSCQNGQCMDAGECQLVLAPAVAVLKNKRAPIPLTCEAGPGDKKTRCSAAAFVPRTLIDTLEGSTLVGAVAPLSTVAAQTADVRITKKVKRRVKRRTGEAQLKLKLNSVGRRLLKRLRTFDSLVKVDRKGAAQRQTKLVYLVRIVRGGK